MDCVGVRPVVTETVGETEIEEVIDNVPLPESEIDLETEGVRLGVGVTEGGCDGHAAHTAQLRLAPEPVAT